jgi:hypothetical protein
VPLGWDFAGHMLMTGAGAGAGGRGPLGAKSRQAEALHARWVAGRGACAAGGETPLSIRE